MAEFNELGEGVEAIELGEGEDLAELFRALYTPPSPTEVMTAVANAAENIAESLRETLNLNEVPGEMTEYEKATIRGSLVRSIQAVTVVNDGLNYLLALTPEDEIERIKLALGGDVSDEQAAAGERAAEADDED